MKWFGDIRIRSKLMIVFGTLTFIMISFALFAVVQIKKTGDYVNSLISSTQISQFHISEAVAYIYRMRFITLSKGYLVSDDDFARMVSMVNEDHERNAALFIEHLRGFSENMTAESRLTESEKQLRLDMVRELKDSFDQYLELVEKSEAAVRNRDKERLVLLFEEVIPVGEEIIVRVQELRDLIFQTAREKTLEMINDTTRTMNVIFAMTAVFIFLSIYLLLFTIENISIPIMDLEKAAGKIADGDLTYPVRSERKDEFGILSSRIGDMVDEISGQNNKIMAIMDNLDSMICVSDMNHNLLFANKRMAEAYGILREENNMHKCRCGEEGNSRCVICQMPALLAENDSSSRKDYEYLWDGVLNAWIGGSTSIIRWVDGTMVYFHEMRDVTRKKQHEELLGEALEAAKAASVAKSSFLANMSHEIRTPMNAIIGITEIQLMNENHAPEMREALSKIYNAGDLLLNIINDILDLSRIEAGKLELSPSKYEIASLIYDTATLNMMRVGSKQIEFKLSVDENTPRALFGDDLRIRQILSNLLSNAFKYTDKGEVKLSVSVEEAKGSEVTLVFEVSDTGHGMTGEQIDKLFDEYARFSAEGRRITEGTGLGMSITQNLLNLMNGEISVRSELDVGSTFIVRLPQQVAGSDVLGAELAENLKNFRADGMGQIKRARIIFEPMPYGSVLLVDDVESNLYVATGLLAPYGLKVDAVLSGFEAVEKIKKGNAYDIVFMDHMMPRMDGMEATKIIRGMGYERPIIALTANAVAGQSDMFLANGFDEFISKPIDVRQLNAVLKKFVRDKQSPEVINAANRREPNQEHVVIETAETARPPLNPRLIESFLRDAAGVLAELERIYTESGAYDGEDMQTYIINVHAMKSALINVREAELSALAAGLERAARENDVAVISSETSVFLDGLRMLIRKLSPEKSENDDNEALFEDYAYLREKLLFIEKASEIFDKKTAKDAIAELRQKNWPNKIGELLGQMANHLLEGDFEEISVSSDSIIDLLNEKSL